MRWIDDWKLFTTDPGDGGGPVNFWWEDMRPKEVRELVQRAYERGFANGVSTGRLEELDTGTFDVDPKGAEVTT